MAGMDVLRYVHSPVHKAVVTKDYAGLKKILAGLPRLCNPNEIRTEGTSIVEEQKADAISAVIDRRDVPNRETPLHLAVKLGDETATEMLMVAGADWSLQNEQGWSALQEAICNKEKEVMNALDGAGAPATDAEVQQEVTAMSQTSIFRPGIDVTQAVLLPQVTWRRQERTEMVGQWKAKSIRTNSLHNLFKMKEINQLF